MLAGRRQPRKCKEATATGQKGCVVLALAAASLALAAAALALTATLTTASLAAALAATLATTTIAVAARRGHRDRTCQGDHSGA